MADSLYSILMGMANNPMVLREATKKARPKIKRDYDKNVREKMIKVDKGNFFAAPSES